MRVLLVEDDQSFRARLALSLEQRGVTVTQVQGVPEARDVLSRATYDAAILDLKLAEGNGLSLIPLVRAQHPTARIVILTGYGSAYTATQALKLGAVDFLAKPVSTAEVLKAIGIQEVAVEKPEVPLPTLEAVETEYLNRVLLDCDGNVSKAAKVLGLHRRSLQRKLARR